MLGEAGGRGAILEQCLCKLMALKQENCLEKIQVVGMTATLGNSSELCRFLNANLFRTHFRPVELVERIKLHDKLYIVEEDGSWRLEKDLAESKRNKVGLDLSVQILWTKFF